MTETFFLIIIMLLLSAFFSGMEIAFLSQDKLRLQIALKQKGLFASINNQFSKNSGRFITTLLIGNNVTLVIYGMLMGDWLANKYDVSSLWGQTIISTIVVLLLAEYIPKVFFRLVPDLILKIFAIPAFVFYILLTPFAYLLVMLVRLVINILFFTKVDDKKVKQVFSKIDLTYFLDGISHEEQHQDQEEIKIFRNVLDFSDIKARDCLMPRTEIVGIEKSDVGEGLIDLATQSGRSKIIVYDNNIDSIVGYISMSQLFRDENNSPKINEVIFVPETFSAEKLLQQLLSEKKKIAVIIDEFGGTAGIVTVEDIIEEIFGEISDEFDDDRLVEQKINDNEYILSARLEIDTLNEKHQFDLPESAEYETLAGLILHTNESMPERGDVIEIDDNISLQVLVVSDTKIETVKLIYGKSLEGQND